MQPATIELDPTQGLQGLTSAQQQFARLVFSGLNTTEAYCRAYNMAPDNPNAGKLAWRLMQDPRIDAKLADLRIQAERATTLAPILDREWALAGIKEIASNTANKPQVRLAAYIAFGKSPMVGLYKESDAPDAKPISTEDMDKRILELLRAGMATIDGVAHDVTPAKEKAPGNSPAPGGRKRKPRE